MGLPAQVTVRLLNRLTVPGTDSPLAGHSQCTEEADVGPVPAIPRLPLCASDCARLTAVCSVRAVIEEADVYV